MAILCTINASKEVIWQDTDGVVWKGTTDVIWKDQEGSNELFLSLNGQDLDHYWDPFIKSFGSPQYKLATEYGGYEELNFGTMVFSPEAFENNWPPPKELTINMQYTGTTEAAAILVFEGDVYLNDYDELGISYDIKAPKFTQKLLDVGPDYNDDTVPHPKAFGPITHEEPLRVADNAGRPTYHLAGIDTSSVAFQIVSFDLHSAGAATKVTTASAHGYGNGQTKTLEGSINFNGSHVISNVTANSFTIPVAFPSDNSETLPLRSFVFTAGVFRVYDDGVPIQENVVIIGDGTFALSASPVGKVTISGTPSSLTTLLEIMTWGQQRLVGVGSIISTNARGTSPDTSYWATSQVPLIDFMSDLCAFFTHYFFIKESVLTLGDMLLDNGSVTLTEGEYFKAVYSARNARSQVRSSWITHEAAVGTVNNDGVNKQRYIKDIPNNVVESLYQVATGTTDGTEVKNLIDSGATFSTDGIKVGHVAQNTTDDTSTIVKAVSETILKLQDDIFISGEDYVVGPSFPYGQKLSVEAYHNVKSNAIAALQNILLILSKDVAEVAIPLEDPLPDPGKRFTFPDTQLVVDTSTYIRTRDLIYDFDSPIPKVIISGEGVVS